MAAPIRADQDFLNTSRLVNLPDPTLAQHGATKAYVDSAVEGLAWKDSVRVSTVGNISLASPGATIDGITMVSGDRVLVRLQTTGAENGIYVWTGGAAALTRSLDANTAAELEQAVTTVEEGTSAGASYRQSVVNATLGTTALSWASFGTGAGSASETTAGVAEIATQTETDAGTDDLRFVTPLKLATYANRKLKYSADFGDGAATSYTITHNLGTKDVQVTVYEVGGSFREALCEVQHTSVNSVTILAQPAPASNSLRVTVLG